VRAVHAISGAFDSLVFVEGETTEEIDGVLDAIGHIPGVILGALLLAALPEVLRYVADPLQNMTGGRLDASILRQLLVALAMISIMLIRPRGLWPSPEHGKAAPTPAGGKQGGKK